MEVIAKDFYKIVSDPGKQPAEIASNLKKQSQLQQDNLVLNLMEHEAIAMEDLMLFLPVSNSHRSGKKSFVIVNTAFSIDEIPEEILVVPSLREAEDWIQMEEMERELGF